MSLRFEDFQNIRFIMQEELDKRITPLENRLEAVENDVKEIYFMLSDVRPDLNGLMNPGGKSAKASSPS